MSNVFQKKDFYDVLANRNILLTDKQKKQFADYTSLLLEWNQKVNLTAITNEDEIYEKHFLDSIIPSFSIHMCGTFCDVGAGAGFPSIPLKIIYPDLHVTIIETLGKRVNFLNTLCKELQLQDVLCVHARAEDYARDHREIFDFVSARAVANLQILCELCIPLVKVHGYFIAMKGPQGLEELSSAQKAITLLGCSLKQQCKNELHDGSKRINFIFEKTLPTPLKYPRAFAQMKKSPL